MKRTVTKTLRRAGDVANPYRSKLDKARVDKKREGVRWFRPTEDDEDGRPIVHKSVFTLVERLQQKQMARQEMALHLACLYDDVEFMGIGAGTYEPAVYEASKLAFNVVRQMVDTLTAMVCKERPLPMPLTSGGKFKQQRRAREYGRWIEGDFEGTGVWKLDPTIGRDAVLWGNGFSLEWEAKNVIRHERIFQWEVLVDPREAMRGQPPSVHVGRWMDRLALIEVFPEQEEEIEACDNKGLWADARLDYDDTSDQVFVVHSWHPPSATGETKDGKRALCISNATLEFEDYKRPYVPLAQLRMMNPLIGFFSTGLGQLLTGLQFTINDMSLKVQELMNLAGTYLTADDASDIQTEHFDNDPFSIIRHAPGHAPGTFIVPPGDPAQWGFVQQLIPWANQITGVSQQASQAEKPAGVTAARALEHLSDEQTGRFSIFSKNWDQYHLDVAQIHTDLAEEIQARGGKVMAQVASRMPSGRRQMRDLNFADVRLDRDSYVLQVWPTSILPKTPAGRIEIIDDLSAKGFIDKSEARMLLDFPDLDRAGNISQSSYNAITAALDDIQDRGKYSSPDPFMSFDMAIALGLQAYLDAKVDGADTNTLKMLRKWVMDARRAKKKATPPPPPAPPGAPPMPGAPPPAMPPPMAA